MAKAKQLKSYREDKAVHDNNVESWLCVDCGVNTAPGFPSGPEIRVAFALGTKKLQLTMTTDSEVYYVKDAIWEEAGMRPWSGCLCVGCLEQRLGRQLRPKDFARHDDKTWAEMPASDRLLDRRGFRRIKVRTKDGEEEVVIDKRTADEIAKSLPPGELPYMEADDC
jgi:hypothetical protein